MKPHSLWRASASAIVLAHLLVPALRAATANPEKTLVSWVTLANLSQRGGSVLTLQQGGEFDAIVFGEKATGRWMAGSANFARTQPAQDSNPEERTDPTTLVQMAVVYRARGIELYRNGTRYASYEAHTVDLLSAETNAVVFGLRHLGATSGQTFQGTIEEARIYDQALSPEQIQHLTLNERSAIKPYAWWTFATGEETDRAGRFAVNCLTGGARIENGRLVLDKPGAALVAMRELPPAKSTAPAADEADLVKAHRELRQRLLGDRTRPLYHLVSPEGKAWPADPNGAVYWKGRYHLHFIAGRDWAHVSSLDMVHWRWHPPTRLGSGSMNSGGLFLNKEGIPTIIYNDYGVRKNQLATALDDNLEQWSPAWPIEPTIGPGQDATRISTWDPDAWREGDHYYALFGGHPYEIRPATLMKSPDLKHWEYLGPFMTREMPGVDQSPDSTINEDISCPNFFKIGNKHMLLCISHLKGCRYYLGTWKDEKFTPEFHARMNWSRAEGQAPGKHGGDFFAPESLLTPDGRRVMWAWCLGGGNPLWDGIQSLPRELSLPRDGVLRIKPIRELETLRYNPVALPPMKIASGEPRALNGVAGDSMEILLRIRHGEAKRYGIRLHASPDRTRGIDLVVDPGARTIQLGATTAPFDLQARETLQLRIFIDRRIVEVFANDRQALFKQHAYEPDEVGVCLFSAGGSMDVAEIKTWRIAPSNPW